MSNPFDTPPGGKSKENPNERILSYWRQACKIADIEQLIEKLGAAKLYPGFEKAQSVMVEREKKLLEKMLTQIQPQTREFLEEARAYTQSLAKRETSLNQSPLGQLKEEIMHEAAESSEEDGEGEESAGFMNSVSEFLEKIEGGLESRGYKNIATQLLDILEEIYYDIKYLDFTSAENTEERKRELKTLKHLNLFLSTLDRAMQILKPSGAPIQGADFIQDVVDALQGESTGKLIPSLHFAFQKIMEDLESRTFNEIAKIPAEVKIAQDNLKRGKDAVN